MFDLIMYNLNEPAYYEAKGLSKVWEAYANECSRDEIFQVGFNRQKGYVYISLENGITITSSSGRSVEYMINDFEHYGEKLFFDSIKDAHEQRIIDRCRNNGNQS